MNSTITDVLIAETVRIEHPESSYGVFCFNSMGDLFVNSDWGFFGYAWRAYSGTFKQFLAQTNSDYIVGKFEINYREVANKKMPLHKIVHLRNLVDGLIEHCKNS